jgi:hypothetical protein
MMLVVPFQGYAAAAMAFCTPEPAQLTVGVAHHDHIKHDHASPGGADHHAAHAQGAQDDPSNVSHKCGNCAACHSVGMTPTLCTAVLHGLPRADLAEPFHAMASVSPGVPHKPPRA